MIEINPINKQPNNDKWIWRLCVCLVTYSEVNKSKRDDKVENKLNPGFASITTQPNENDSKHVLAVVGVQARCRRPDYVNPVIASVDGAEKWEMSFCRLGNVSCAPIRRVVIKANIIRWGISRSYVHTHASSGIVCSLLLCCVAAEHITGFSPLHSNGT